MGALNSTKKEPHDPLIALGLKLVPKQKALPDEREIAEIEERLVELEDRLTAIAEANGGVYPMHFDSPERQEITILQDRYNKLTGHFYKETRAKDLAQRALDRLRRSKAAGPYSWAARAAGLRDAVEVQRGLVEEKEAAIELLMRGPIGDVAAAKAALENDLRPLVAHLNWLINEQAHAASMVGEDQKETKDHATDALASEIFEVEGQLSEARASQAVLRTHIREAEADSAAWDRTISVLERRLAELEAKYEYAADREVGYRERRKMWDDVDEGMFILKRKRDEVQTELNRLTVTLERRKQEWARLSSMLDNPGTEDSSAQQIRLRRDRQAIDEEIDTLHEQYQEVEAELNAINIELADIMAIRPKERKTKDAAYFSSLARDIQEQKQLVQNLETVLWVDLRSPSFRSLAESEKDEIVRKTQEVSDQLQRAKRDLADMLTEWDNRPTEYKEVKKKDAIEYIQDLEDDLDILQAKLAEYEFERKRGTNPVLIDIDVDRTKNRISEIIEELAELGVS